MYLIEAIYLICNSNNYIKEMSNLELNIYRRLADKYHISQKTLKSDIVKATNNADKFISLKNKNEFYIKLTPKYVIYYVVDIIKST